VQADLGRLFLVMRPEAGPNLFAKVVSARPVFVVERNFLAPPYLFAKLLNEENISLRSERTPE
jgi:hypothetical protein